jgi:hydroxymethylpyrimidine pyrophosphatase-like HAD family hydrolase
VGTASQKTGSIPEIYTEHDFYTRYAWCLNPLQPLNRLLARLNDELRGYARLGIGWQQQEARINLYLLTNAINCTVADQLTPRMPPLDKLTARWPKARTALNRATNAARAAERLGNQLMDGRIAKWLGEWKTCVDLSCEILLQGLGAESQQVAQLSSMSWELSARALPGWLFRCRMQIPSGFRAQDLTHQDAVAMADTFDDGHSTNREELALVGARTAGAYLAPVMHARLQQRGWKTSWISVRPKNGVSYWEKEWIQELAGRSARVLVVDDHPDTGETIRLMIKLMEDCGFDRKRITVVVPSHEAQRSPAVLTGGYRDVDLVTLAPGEHYKQKLLNGSGVRPLLEEMVPGAQWVDDDETKAINRELAAHLKDDYQVHVKHVYAFRTGGTIRRVVAKSTGWGWLGYHGYLAGTRLQEFVPQVLGLRQGLLFSEWIENESSPEPSEMRIAARIASYTAARVKRLSLEGQAPVTEMAECMNASFALAKLLRGAYPLALRWLKMPALWEQLKPYATTQPAFIDGKLGAGEWLNGRHGVLKTDYEHHGFGNPAPNVADAAYDLALAGLEWKLSPEAQQFLLEQYASLTGDDTAGERVVLYQMVCARQAADLARFQAGRAQNHEDARHHEAEHIAAFNFLTYSMARFCGQRFTPEPALEWHEQLFFMDLDGVFDRSFFFFPHTTACGMAALETLERNGYSVVLNTGRPAAHVRQYCSSYGMAGGIAEYGCVFVDHIHERETVLINDESREQLAWLRARLRDQNGIYLDPTYEVAIRAYRVEKGQGLPLTQEFLNKVLRDFPLLTSVVSDVDTYIIPVEAGKGSATKRVMDELKVRPEATAAMGDMENDLPMLEAVGKAYVPANANSAMCGEALRRKFTVVNEPYQRGLLRAVRELTDDGRELAKTPTPEHEHILIAMLRVADRSPLQHCLGALRYKRL